MSGNATGSSSLWSRWKAVDPWTRFGVIGLATLIVAAFIPSWRIPGPSVPATTTTTMPASSQVFEFTAADFLSRWNEMDLGDPNLESALRVSQYSEVGPTSSSFLINIPEAGVAWTVIAFSELGTGLVTEVELIAPLDADFDSSSLGALMVISSVEGIPIGEAQAIWLDLIDQLKEDADPADPVSLMTTTPGATYRIALSTEVQFLFEASP